MKAQDFCFWLQGYFELGDTPYILEYQVDIIQNHIKMVEIHDPGNDGRSRQFCEWLKVTLSLYSKGNIPTGIVAAIKTTLDEVFLHEIDPSYPAEQQQELDQAHQGWVGANPFPPINDTPPIGWNMQPGQRC